MFLLLIGVAYLSIFRPLPFYNWPVTRFLARISYCFFLLHMVIGFTILHYGHYEMELPANLLIPLTILFIGVLATLIERYIERPSYRLLKM